MTLERIPLRSLKARCRVLSEMVTINDKVKCCGCSACANICHKNAIRMVQDAEGFMYPKADASLCNNCGLCEKVCPVTNKEAHKTQDLKKAYLIQHRKKDVLAESTSGGAFTAIAEYVISQGGVVFGAAFDSQFKVIHTSAHTSTELAKFRNSKYVQSDLGDTFCQVKSLLSKGTMVCYSGTPCQIQGLRKYLMKDYENLILVDVVCRAVPSPGVWEKYYQYENSKGHIKDIRFRDKKLGYQYSTMAIKTQNGKIRREGIESHPWLRMFFSGMIIRPSCSACRFRDPHRISDITIWDCFNVYQLDKRMNEQLGVTRALVHTEKGQDVLGKICDRIHVHEIAYEDAVKGVKEMRESPAMHPDRRKFFADLNTMTFDCLLQKYYPNTLKVRVKKTARLALNYLGLDVIVKHWLKKRK